MLKSILKLSAFAAIFAWASSAHAETATATWPMGVTPPSAATATISPANALKDASVAAGSTFTSFGTRTAKPSETLSIKGTTVKSLPIAKDDNGFLLYSVTPSEALNLTKVSLQAWGVKYGGGRFALQLSCGDNTVVLEEEKTTARTQESATDVNEAKSGYTFDYDVTGFDGLTDPVELKVYLWTSDGSVNKRENLVANVTLTFDVPEVQAGDDDCHFSMPGILNLTSGDSAIETNNLSVGDNSLSYVANNSSVTFKNVHAHQTGVYRLVLPLDYSYGTGTLKVEVVDAATGATEATYDGPLPKNNSSYEKIGFDLNGEITKGYKNVTLTFADDQRSYVCNAHSPEFEYVGEYVPDVDTCHFHIPGTLTFISDDPAVTFSGARFQGGAGDVNVGYVKNDTWMKLSNVVCHKAGVYEITMPVDRSGGGIINWKVTDKATGNVEIDYDYTIAEKTGYTPDTFVLGGAFTEGTKEILLTFKASHSGWVLNFKQPTFEWIGEKFAEIKGLELPAEIVEAGEATDWQTILPANFEGETFSFKPLVSAAALEVSAKCGENDVTVTAEADGLYSVPTPGLNDEYIVTLTITPEEGASSAKTVYTYRIFRIGSLKVTALTVDGIALDNEVLDALNSDEANASFANVFTSTPVVEATFVNGDVVTATAGILAEGKIPFTFKGALADMTKDYTLTLGDFHFYAKAADEETVALQHNGGSQDGDSWTNANGYGLSYVSDGYNANFRIWRSGESTISVPGDVVVKQLVFKNISNDYSAPEARIWSVTSEGATTWVPMYTYYNTGKKYDLIVNIDGHQAGQPITFTFGDGQGQGGRLTTEFELIVAHEALTTAPVLRSSEIFLPENANHFVAKLTFDRIINAATVTFNGQEITSTEASSELYFSVWNLEYDHDYTFVIPANTLVDNYGNMYDAEISIPVSIAAKVAPEAAGFDYVVSNVEEWKAAIAAVNASNAKADAPRATIFVLNGDYDFGGEEQTLRTYNVSIVGQSKEGVLLHGKRDGISNPVLSTRYSHYLYLQDLTIRNDLDWDKARGGVGVALYSGDHEIGVNIALQSQQDTQVTGPDSYYLDCDIYGCTDFICGGGNNFYEHCNLFITNGGPITAPSTAPTHLYGYVFDHCTIDVYNKSLSHGSYSLGRPWQNEPRAHFLNTTMIVRPSDTGWTSMSNLPTHFYEFNSMDANGNTLDLSKRQNSPSHVGDAYTPVLTAEQAAKMHVGTVLGEKDSYLAIDHASQCDAPQVAVTSAKQRAVAQTIAWPEVEGARCYAVFKDGQYVDHTTDTSYTPDETGMYTVQAANARGGLGAASEPVKVGEVTGIEELTIGQDSDNVIFYDLYGHRVNNPSTGIYIRVTTAGAEKVIIR